MAISQDHTKMSERDKSIMIPSFSGKDEDFQVWWTKFRAFGTAKGFIKALLGKKQIYLIKKTKI